MDFDDEYVEIGSKTFADNNNYSKSGVMQTPAQDRPTTSRRSSVGRQNSGSSYGTNLLQHKQG